ncbi:hypothetical protein LINPERHAP1_LOCUS27906 [Linum perenne]
MLCVSAQTLQPLCNHKNTVNYESSMPQELYKFLIEKMGCDRGEEEKDVEKRRRRRRSSSLTWESGSLGLPN